MKKNFYNILHEAHLAQARFNTRRLFLKQMGIGLGSVALGGLLGGCSDGTLAKPQFQNPLAPPDAAFCAQGEISHLPAHGRGALPARTV